MIKKSIFLATIFIASLTFQSCGVMFGGSRYDATIIAKDHPEADIYVNGRKAGKGVVSGSYKRDKELQVEIKQEGCEDHSVTFENTFRTGNFILSAFAWGILGIAIDLGTGAAYKPDHRHDPAIEKQSDKNYIFTVEHPDCTKSED